MIAERALAWLRAQDAALTALTVARAVTAPEVLLLLDEVDALTAGFREGRTLAITGSKERIALVIALLIRRCEAAGNPTVFGRFSGVSLLSREPWGLALTHDRARAYLSGVLPAGVTPASIDAFRADLAEMIESGSDRSVIVILEGLESGQWLPAPGPFVTLIVASPTQERLGLTFAVDQEIRLGIGDPLATPPLAAAADPLLARWEELRELGRHEAAATLLCPAMRDVAQLHPLGLWGFRMEVDELRRALGDSAETPSTGQRFEHLSDYLLAFLVETSIDIESNSPMNDHDARQRLLGSIAVVSAPPSTPEREAPLPRLRELLGEMEHRDDSELWPDVVKIIPTLDATGVDQVAAKLERLGIYDVYVVPALHRRSVETASRSTRELRQRMVKSNRLASALVVELGGTHPVEADRNLLRDTLRSMSPKDLTVWLEKHGTDIWRALPPVEVSKLASAQSELWVLASLLSGAPESAIAPLLQAIDTAIVDLDFGSSDQLIRLAPCAKRLSEDTATRAVVRLLGWLSDEPRPHALLAENRVDLEHALPLLARAGGVHLLDVLATHIASVSQWLP